MKDIDSEQIIECLKQLGSINPEAAKTQKAVEKTRLSLEGQLSQRTPRWHMLGAAIIRKGITLAAAAAIIIAVVVMWPGNGNTSKAWAFEQSVEALNEAQTLLIKGLVDGNTPFACWLQRDGNSLLMRFECEDEVVVAKGDQVTAYQPKAGEAWKGNWSTPWGSMFWKTAIQLRLALGPDSLKVLRALADDWREETAQDSRSNREVIIVTCSSHKLSASCQFRFDTQTKHLMEGKFWRNPERSGSPDFYASSVSYNMIIPEGTFTLELPENVVFIKPEAHERYYGQRQKAWEIFQTKDYAQALQAYQQLLADFPVHDPGDLEMLGTCYDNLGQVDKAIEYYQLEIKSWEPNAKNDRCATYFYLGSAYEEKHDWEKALAAYEQCVEAAGANPDPNAFPYKNSQEAIQNIHQMLKK